MTRADIKGIAEKIAAIGRRDVWLKRWRSLAIILLALTAYQFFSVPDKPVMSDHIAIINIDEEITQNSLFWDQFERINSSTKAVMVLMNSPGGTIGDSERLYNTISQLNSQLPLTVLVENYATSGGYLGSIGSDRIYAYNTSIIGSIGIIVQNILFDGLLEKAGVKIETIKTGRHKGQRSYDAMPDDVRESFQELLDDDHAWFVNLVQDRRGLDQSQVKMIKESQVYNARRARQIGLIDGISTREEQLIMLQSEVGPLPIRDLTIDEEDYFGLSHILGSKKKSLPVFIQMLKQSMSYFF